ncbi:hypothetical protein GCM10010431_55970 [Streptomyces kunmingensis]
MSARSGVHLATVYRRWRSADGLIIDAVVDELGSRSPVAATGDLRADLQAWITSLPIDLTEPGHLAFFRALFRAGGDGQDTRSFAEPRIQQIQAALDAAGASVLTGWTSSNWCWHRPMCVRC